jgi:hypothetical protein
MEGIKAIVPSADKPVILESDNVAVVYDLMVANRNKSQMSFILAIEPDVSH